MPIYLKKQFETEISGDGSGFISITQKDESRDTVIWLSIQQFQDICDNKEFLISEALKSE